MVIPKGEGVSGIAERLERDEVITDRGMFVTSIIYFMYLHGAGALKAGEYEFRKAASMRQVLDTLVEGKSIAHKVTLAEGLTSQQIVERIQASPDLQGTITEIPAEGTLLPDTYRFQIGDSRQDIIERMQVAQKKFLAKMWEERDPDIVVQTPEEAVILASIVEKETSRADERPLIASVFQNRLRKKMRLQSDPTIIYGLVGGKGVLDHPITAGRARARDRIQHVQDQRPAADADRQSGAGRDRGCAEAGQDQGPLFRCGRHRRPRLCAEPR